MSTVRWTTLGTGSEQHPEATLSRVTAPGLAWWVHGGVSPWTPSGADGQLGTRRPPSPASPRCPGQSGSPTRPRGCGTSELLPVHRETRSPSPRGPAGGALTTPGQDRGCVAWGVTGGGGGAGICARAACYRVRVPVAPADCAACRGVSTSVPTSPGAQGARTELLQTPGEAGRAPVQPLDEWTTTHVWTVEVA